MKFNLTLPMYPQVETEASMCVVIDAKSAKLLHYSFAECPKHVDTVPLCGSKYVQIPLQTATGFMGSVRTYESFIFVRLGLHAMHC